MSGDSAPIAQTTAVFIQQGLTEPQTHKQVFTTTSSSDSQSLLASSWLVGGRDGKQAATRQDATVRWVALATEPSGAQWPLCASSAPIVGKWTQCDGPQDCQALSGVEAMTQPEVSVADKGSPDNARLQPLEPHLSHTALHCAR